MNCKQIAKMQVHKTKSLTDERQQITVEDLIAKYPEGVTITGFDVIVKNDGKSFSVFLFAEDPGAYFYGGVNATAIAEAWARECDGDIDQANAEVAEQKPVFVLTIGKTKKGNKIVEINVK